MENENKRLRLKIYAYPLMYPETQHILVINISGLAQTTLSLPALRSLRGHFPQSRITVVTSAVASDLLKLAGCADEILAVGRFKHAELIRPAVLFRSTKVYQQLRRGVFDLAIEFAPNTESAIILQLADPRRRLARAKTPGTGIWMIFERTVLRRPPKQLHAAQEYLRTLEPLGVRPLESEPRLHTDKTSDEFIEKLLGKHHVGFGELLVGVHPGASIAKESWPSERFASVAARLVHNFNARVLVFSGPRERGEAKKLAATLPAKRAIVIESPKLTDFISAAARLSLFIANHGGPAHVAAAAGAPVVAVTISAGPSFDDLLGTHHEHVRGSHPALVSEEAVFDAACRLLKISRAEYLRMR